MTSAVASVIPAGILAVIGLGILVANRISKLDRPAKWLCWAALVLAAIALSASPRELTTEPAAPSLLGDGLFRASTWLALAFGLLLSICAADGNGVQRAQRYGLLLLSLSGVVLAGGANDLIVAVIAIELAALPAVVLLFVERDGVGARLTWIQSGALHAVALATFIAGMAMVAGTASTTNLTRLGGMTHAVVLSHARLPGPQSAISTDVGCVFLVAGLGVHFLLFPFQLAVAEIFDGAKFWTVNLMALLPRGAAFLLMIRIFVNGAPQYATVAQTAFIAVGIVSILIGSVVALSQTRFRRLLAFALAVEGGVIIGAMAAACAEAKLPVAAPWLGAQTPGALGAACLCFVFDSLAVVGLLAILGSLGQLDHLLDEIEDVSKRIRGDRVAAISVCILLFSFAGLPPFAGYWGRVAIFRSLLSVSVPSENDFLPHQNISYVAFSLIAAAGSIAIAVVCASVARKLMLADRQVSRHDLSAVPPVTPTREPRRASCWVGLFAAGALVIAGFAPGSCLRVAARLNETGVNRVGVNELGAAIRSSENSPPVPSLAARRRIGIAAP